MATNLNLTLVSDREISMTRLFNAPRRLVFEAFSKPEHVANWWGRRGSTLTVVEIDFRVGGAWRFVSKEADGNEYPFKGEFREIVTPEKIVQTFIFDVPPYSEKAVIDTAVFTEEDGKTRVTTTSLFESKEDRDGMIQSGMEEGATESYDRLAEYLEKLS
jgi:uncharacterized protein YndB with AHSA1/START domain